MIALTEPDVSIEAAAWPRVKLKDLCLAITDCVNKTAPVVSSPTEYKMIRTSNVKNGRIDLTEVKYVDEETYKKWTRRGKPKVGDVILTREAPLGEVGMVRTTDHIFLGQRLVQYIVDPERLNNKFLLYALQADDLQGQIKACGSGSTVEHMRVPDAGNLEVALPPLAVQERIGAALSAYDDLFEANLGRISCLETIIQLIYTEWFVHFRFPGHQTCEFVDSDLGRIPSAWSVVGIRDVIEFNPKVKVPKEGEKPFVPMGSLSNDSMVIQDVERRTGNSGTKFQNADTLFARITPCLENGKTGYVQFLAAPDSIAFGSTEFIVMRSKTLCPEYVYLLARSPQFRDHAIKSMTGATGRQRVQESCFDSYWIAKPTPDVISRFSDIARPIFNQIETLHRQCVNLRITRDILLPKLITGELDVSTVDIDMGETDE